MNQLKTASLEQLVESLYARINYEGKNRPRPGDFKLANMYRLLEELGNPHLACPVIHVAGTKGKGSVSTMIRTILSQSTKRIGSYNSPHLDRINQRISVGDENISDEDLRQSLLEIWPTIERFDQASKTSGEKRLTFFEVITAAAFVYFAKQKLDAVVLEVGMGGRLDSTNVCQPILAVITSISFDHTKQLGSTLDLIAREKAGIIKAGVPVISGVVQQKPADAIREIATKNGSEMFELGEDFQIIPGADHFAVNVNLPQGGQTFENLSSGLPGKHQVENASVAVAACAVLNAIQSDQLAGKKLGWKISADAVREGLAKVTLPGRSELLSQSPAVLVDIAHNPASMVSLADTLLNHMPAFNRGGKRHLVFAASRDKDVAEMLKPILALFDEIWLTKYAENPRGMPVDQLQTVAIPMHEKIQTADNPQQVWEKLGPALGVEDFVCVCGSAFLVAELRPTLISWAANNR